MRDDVLVFKLSETNKEDSMFEEGYRNQKWTITFM